MTDTPIDFPPNCSHCGQSNLSASQLRALTAAATKSKAAGMPNLLADAELEIRRRARQAEVRGW